MDREKVEHILLIFTFVIALLSFIYSSIDFLGQFRSRYEMSILGYKTYQDRDNTQFLMESDFIISNTGNRSFTIIDSWISLEIEESRLADLPDNEKLKEDLNDYIRDYNYYHFSRSRSDWELLKLVPGDSESRKIGGTKDFTASDYYNILPYSTDEVKRILDGILSIFRNSKHQEIEKTNYMELKELRTKKSRYINLNLNFRLQLENDEHRYVKIPYDYVVLYSKNIEIVPAKAIQIKSYFPRLNNLIRIDLDDHKSDKVEYLEITE